MSFRKFSKLFVLTMIAYFISNSNISLPIANAQTYIYEPIEIEPYKIKDISEPEILEEELPELKDAQIPDYEDYDYYSIEEPEQFRRVGLILPLSGDSKAIGESMLNAAKMALFDAANTDLELIIEDSKGTELGAKMATQLAISKGAQVILGPVFSKTTESIKKIAKENDIKIISFSNNWKLADRDTFLMGFMPYYQIMDILSYAEEKEYKNLAVIIPDNIYGDLVEEILSLNKTINVVKIDRIKSDTDVHEFIKEFSGYNERKKALDDEIAFFQDYMNELDNLDGEITNKEIQKRMSNEEFFSKYARYKDLKDIQKAVEGQLETLKSQTTEGELDFDSVLIAFGGDSLREIASLLSYYDVSPEKIKFLGTGLFDDETLNDEPALIGAWYAAPYSKKLASFEKEYYKAFQTNPIRIASIAYDAIHLLAKMVEMESQPNYKNLTNNSGFIGIDGPFKFSKNGLIERELSIMQIRKNRPAKAIQ